MEDTSGFYKLDGALLFGPNEIIGPDIHLLREHHSEYLYPVDGWYWFEGEDEARVALDVPVIPAPAGSP